MKNNLLIIAQVITIIVILTYIISLVILYFSSWWDTLGASVMVVFSFFFCVFLFICWGLYGTFTTSMSSSMTYLLHILIWVISITLIIYQWGIIKEKIEKYWFEKKHTAWEQWAIDKEYTSAKLGITFRYVSENFTYGPVTFEETNDAVRLSVWWELSGMIQVHSKDPKLSLIEALRKDFKGSKCIPNDDSIEFYNKYPEYGISGLPDSYTSFILDNTNNVRSEWIIDFPSYPSAGSYNKAYAVMDTQNPDRYLIIISWKIDIDASKAESAFNGKSWRSTVRFVR